MKLVMMFFGKLTESSAVAKPARPAIPRGVLIARLEAEINETFLSGDDLAACRKRLAQLYAEAAK